MFTRRNKVLIPIILVLSMLLFVSPMYAFTNDSISKQDRFEIINTPAFYTIGNPDSEEPCGFKNLSTDELMSITDKEFRKTIKDNIMWAITQHSNGETVYWYPDSYKLVNKIAPELAPSVITQTHNQNQYSSASSITKAVKGSFTPGSSTASRYVESKSLGLVLYRFTLRMNWSWDTTRITSVSRRCSANVYNTNWTYNGINDEFGHYLTSYSYNQYSEGEMQCGVQRAYPWVEAVVQAGGVNNWWGGHN